ncbi:hypothetical protein AVEN_36660-1 [Araneus ventricosus]|uniref:Uncharacterized protein n=1 Tax=Araneus ventricosus TaxID=182803 RepID=A0A4Y2VZR0_ARAVE|nr:hypothetical protein AVEN_36660-1 [Araneus ventricosus]
MFMDYRVSAALDGKSECRASPLTIAWTFVHSCSLLTPSYRQAVIAADTVLLSHPSTFALNEPPTERPPTIVPLSNSARSDIAASLRALWMHKTFQTAIDRLYDH